MIRIKCVNDSYEVESDSRLPEMFLSQVNKFVYSNKNGKSIYVMKNFPSTAYLLFHLNKKHPELCSIDDKSLTMITEKAKLIDDPVISMFDDKHIGISCPLLPFYLKQMKSIGGYSRSYTLYTVPFSRAHDVIRILTKINTFLPGFTLTDEVKTHLFLPLLRNNSISDLYRTSVAQLYSVHFAYRVNEENFFKANYKYLSDLLINRPLRYIDKTQITDKFSWKKGDPVVLIGKITNKTNIKNQHAQFDIITGKNNLALSVIFFRRFWMLDKFNIGDTVLIIGNFYYQNNISGSSMDSLAEANSIPIVPIYSQSQKNGVSTRLLMSATHEILDRTKLHPDIAPYLNNSKYMPILKAFHELHFPSNIENYKIALNALAFYELTYMQLEILHKKNTDQKAKGLSKKRVAGKAYDGAINGLPWDLTPAQKKALVDIDKRLSSPSAEQILLSAEVGSGKTLIAQLTCLQSVDAGYQAVLAAPTEVLAQQLYETFVKLLNGIPSEHRPTITYLSGKTKIKDKNEIIHSIEYGDTDIVVGTHSVLNNNIKYHNLGVVCVDEQQKFGSAQRENLLSVRNDGHQPDLLTQTATPIPRSTAQAFYGDIDIITMEGKPKGRLPVDTKWVKEDPDDLLDDKNNAIWKDMVHEAKLGHKTFIVVPMVYDNSKISAASVQNTYKKLTKEFPDLDIEYAHGQMKQELQDKHINHFRKKGDVLVASTVIEVGIDIPEATRMIILSADRLGASSLHQIRGRVGRNSIPSKCFLVSNNSSKQSNARLQGLVDTDNGFKIAQIDLKTRGEGDLFGLRQAGDSQLKFVSLVDDSELIKPARQLAQKIYDSKYKERALNDAKYVLSINEEDNND